MQSTESATRLSGAHWPTLKTNLMFWTKIFVIQIYKNTIQNSPSMNPDHWQILQSSQDHQRHPPREVQIEKRRDKTFSRSFFV